MHVRRIAHFSLRSIVGAALAAMTAAASAGTATLSISDSSLGEGNSGTQNMGFTIVRGGDLTSTIKLSLATADGTATAPADYVSLPPTTLTIAPGQTFAEIGVPIVGDTLFEPDETFSVSFVVNEVLGPPVLFDAGTGIALSGDRAIPLTAGDVNGDGKPDILAAPQFTVFADVLLNTTAAGAPTPSFSGPTTISSGSGSSQSIQLADWNTDGFPDIVNCANGSVGSFLNQKDPSTPFDLGHGNSTEGGICEVESSLAIGDLNDDGRPDAAFTDINAGVVGVVLNNTPSGGNVPTFRPKVTFAAGIQPVAVAIGDLNGDGKPDLVVGNWGNFNPADEDIAVLINQTASGATVPDFGAAQHIALQRPAYSIGLGDFNQDGKLDIAVAERNFGQTFILLNTTATGSPTATFASPVSFPEQGGLNVAVADLNDDGRPDLIYANENNTSPVSVLINQTTPGADTPDFSAPIGVGSGNSGEAIGIGDFNGDGLLDIAVTNFPSNLVQVYLQTTELFNVAVLDNVATGTIINDDAAPPPPPSLDFGDAPASYGTLLAQDGARHIITGVGPFLGSARPDAEADGQPNAAATGDDGNGVDDEDGVVMLLHSDGGVDLAQVTVGGANGVLDAWVDFNMDGDFNDPNEQIVTSQPVTVGANNILFVDTLGGVTAPIYARFRISSAGGLGPTGLAQDGEVEDYRVIAIPPENHNDNGETHNGGAFPLATLAGLFSLVLLRRRRR